MSNKKEKYTKKEMQGMAINAARELIFEGGPSNCSARKIADKTNFTAGTLYNIFENFNEIIIYVNISIYNDLIKFIKPHVKQINLAKTSTESMKHFAALYIIFLEENQNHWNSIINFQQKNQKVPEFYSGKIDEIMTIISNIFIEKANMSDDEAKRSAYIIWAGLNGINSFTSHNNINKNTKSHILIEDFIENYINGLIKKT